MIMPEKLNEEDTMQKTLGKKLSEDKWYQLLEIIIVFLPVSIVLIAFRLLDAQNQILQISAIWASNIVMLGVVWYGIKLRGETLLSIGLSFQLVNSSKVGWTILKSLPILIFAACGFILGSIIMANIVGIPEGSADMTKYNYLQDNLPMLIVSLAGAYFASSFGEEVVYRGFLITRLQNIFGGDGRGAVVMAIILSSVIFGFAHFEWGAMGIGQTTFMGAAFGISYLLTKRILWPLVLAHAYMDTILFIQLYMAA